MKHIRAFNESFDGENYYDFIAVRLDGEDNDIYTSDITDNYVYMEIKLNKVDPNAMLAYLKGQRFSDIKFIRDVNRDLNSYTILLIDQEFYDKHQEFLFDNLKWVDHSIYTSFKQSESPFVRKMADEYEAAKQVDPKTLPEGLSIIKNIDRFGRIEIFNDSMDEPIKLWDNEKARIQYLLYKYCVGNK